MSRQWLLENAPGFAALPEPDREAIFDFAILWSLFEARVMDGFARVDRICIKVDEWQAAGALDPPEYGATLAYFRNRYFENGGFTDHFEKLRLHHGDQPALVAAVLNGSNKAPRDEVVAVLIVIWRFRNNLFHGEKWSYQLQGQLENFTHANGVLMRALERHGQLDH